MLSTLRRRFRTAALSVLLVGVGTWFVTGAHRGWTQTSTFTLQRDEITGIDYPVRRRTFVAGVEIPLAAAVLAAGLVAASFLPRRRHAPRS